MATIQIKISISQGRGHGAVGKSVLLAYGRFGVSILSATDINKPGSYNSIAKRAATGVNVLIPWRWQLKTDVLWHTRCGTQKNPPSLLNAHEFMK